MAEPEVNDPGIDYGHVGQSVYLVSISVHMWRGQYNLRNAAVRLGKVELAKEVVTSPRWKLMPDGWHDQFTKVESKIRGLVDRLAPRNTENYHLPLRGVDVVPKKKLKELFDEVRKIEEEEFKPLVSAFSQEWPGILNWLREKVGDENWQFAAKHLPSSPRAVAAKFYVEKCVIPVTLSGDPELLKGSEAEEYAEEIHGYVQQFAQITAQTIVAGLQQELNDAVDNLYNSICEGKVVKTGTLEIVRRAFSKLEGFDFVMTDELKAKVNEVKEQLEGLEPKDVNKDIKDGAKGLAGTLAKALTELRNQTGDETKAFRRFGRKRSIEV